MSPILLGPTGQCGRAERRRIRGDHPLLAEREHRADPGVEGVTAELVLDLVGDINLKRDLDLRAESAFALVDDELRSASMVWHGSAPMARRGRGPSGAADGRVRSEFG